MATVESPTADKITEKLLEKEQEEFDQKHSHSYGYEEGYDVFEDEDGLSLEELKYRYNNKNNNIGSNNMSVPPTKRPGIVDFKSSKDVNQPSHYTSGRIEVIDVIEDWKLGFHLGNAVKYIARAGKKDPKLVIQDLEKAMWYISRKIERIQNESEM